MRCCLQTDADRFRPNCLYSRKAASALLELEEALLLLLRLDRRTVQAFARGNFHSWHLEDAAQLGEERRELWTFVRWGESVQERVNIGGRGWKNKQSEDFFRNFRSFFGCEELFNGLKCCFEFLMIYTCTNMIIYKCSNFGPIISYQ